MFAPKNLILKDETERSTVLGPIIISISGFVLMFLCYFALRGQIDNNTTVSVFSSARIMNKQKQRRIGIISDTL